MERLTMCIDSHLLDDGKFDKEYSLNNKIQLNEYSCMDIPNAVYNKLGELEDVLEKYGIETTEELDGVLKPLIDNCELENWRRVIFWKTQNEKLKQQLHSQPAEIVGKIRSKCCVEDKCKDGSFVLGINEKDLDTILKEYQK